MQEAQHRWWAEALFRPYVFYLMRKQFHGIYSLGQIPEIDPDYPLLLVPNHGTWWDGFLVYLLNVRLIGRTLYLMMLERQLRHYWFFQYVGAYPINPGNTASVRKSLSYTAYTMERHPDQPVAICIFPQGELRPARFRSLSFRRGIEVVLKKYEGAVNLLPLGIYAGFFLEQRPEVYLRFGENTVLSGQSFPGMEWLEQEVESVLGKLRAGAGTEEGRRTTLLSRERPLTQQIISGQIHPDGKGEKW